MTSSFSFRFEGLSDVPWTFVVDFDPNSLETGLASLLRKSLREKRAVRDVVLGDQPTIHVETSCYWYFARGVADRQSTLTEPSWTAWRRKYGRDVAEQLRSLADARLSRPVTIVAIWDSEDYLDTVFSSALDVFGETVDFIIAHPEAHRLTRSVDRFEAKLIEIDIQYLAEGMHSTLSNNIAVRSEDILLPTKGGTQHVVGVEERRYLEEELEIVGLTSGTVADEDRETCIAFFKGKQITWFELGLHCDVERDKTDRIFKTVQQDLGGGQDRRSKGTTRINLYHFPGAGGSTVARRICWNLHSEFPTVVLKRCMPAETASRIELIYKSTGLPILLLIEGANVQESQAEDLYSILRARQVSVVFFQVLRRFTSAEERERSFFLQSELTHLESARFAHRLAETRPQRRTRLLSLVSKGLVEERTAFYLALETFEENFEGLAQYVSVRLDQATPEQSTILVFLAFAYHYGQQALPSDAFGPLLAMPRNRRVELEKYLPAPLRDLLRRGSSEAWRTAHDLIAQQVLKRALSPNSLDDRTWRQNLSTWALRFAEFCRGDDPVPSRDLIEIASRCFVFRDDRDPLRHDSSEDPTLSGFSQLLQDIPSQEGRLRILIRLTELFPSEAHFWGHLGRFYSLQMRDTANSLRALDQAIAISPEDDVLYHMKGMALRAQLYDSMQTDVGPKGSLEEALEIARQAAEQFTIARSKEPNDEHGYVSHIQMLLKLLDYAKRATGAESGQEILISPTVNSVLRESLDFAEDLLDQARRLKEGEKPSVHVERCRVQMDALYGRFDTVLQGWNNLLARPDIYRPPIRRQLVQAYLVRRNRRWDTLDAREVGRVLDLLNENLLEEPNDRRNLRLWMQAVRRAQPPMAIDHVIERISYWKANSIEIDAVYYLYILYALKALEGYALALDPLRESLEECKRRARLRPNRTGSFEWVGSGHDLTRLVHYTELGDWNNDLDFWGGASKLSRIRGSIVSISGPEAGLIEVKGGLKAFFVPGKSGHFRGRDENRIVDCFLGFSYDGPRSWEVRNAQI